LYWFNKWCDETEEAIQQINEISSKIIDEINEYENELIEFNK